MRIIAGTARGMPLAAPKGRETRPTQDRVKESLFSILQAHLEDARVLDLFAGSGALALEALSRGASFASLADMDREAVACIRRNVERLGFGHCTRLYPCDWKRAVGQMAREGLDYSLVFLDPPYRMTELDAICAELAGAGLLREGAVLALEHRAGLSPSPDGRFVKINERRYGDSEIHFYRFHKEGTP